MHADDDADDDDTIFIFRSEIFHTRLVDAASSAGCVHFTARLSQFAIQI
jgi:hypothetical protein